MSILFDDASSQYLEHAAAPVTAYPFSFSIWVYTNDVAAYQAAMFIGDVGETDEYANLAIKGDSPGDYVYASSRSGAAGWNHAISGAGVSVSTWHNIIGIWASATSRKVILDNGTPVEETTSVAITTWDRFAIGRLSDSSPGLYFSGELAEPAIWDAALSVQSITDLQTIYPNEVQTGDLVAAYHLNNAADLNDLVNSYDLTAYNTPTNGSGHPSLSSAVAGESFAKVLIKAASEAP